MRPLPPDLHIFITADGSPTLQFERVDGYAEKMHHSGGALSESIYIYQHALELALTRGWPGRVLSVGLGLGYNELLAIAAFTRRGLDDWQVWSFESSDFLRGEFTAWLSGGPHEGPLRSVLEIINRMVAEHAGLPPNDLQSALYTAWKKGSLVLAGAFSEGAGKVRDANVVFYDAYSNKMSPALWAEHALVEELEPKLSSQCVFCTYAATGALNRALKALDFRRENRPGFLGKRESTLALRE